jgi:hypothetical protein
MEVGESRGCSGLKDSNCVRTRSHDVLKVDVEVPGLLETSQMRDRLLPLRYQNQIRRAAQWVSSRRHSNMASRHTSSSTRDQNPLPTYRLRLASWRTSLPKGLCNGSFCESVSRSWLELFGELTPDEPPATDAAVAAAALACSSWPLRSFTKLSRFCNLCII